jgi:pimeloyl-ACP methyl ester carboxylesterase
MRNPIQKFVSVDGARVCLFDWPALPQAQQSPALLFAHGASFHARVWDAVIERLPHRCIALDLRGHGRSDAPALPLQWRIFADDVIAAADDMKAKALIGIGHSLGGHAIAQAAALRPDLFDSLLLIDPVVLPQAAYRLHSGEPNPAARRRADFESVEAIKEKLGARLPFSQWDPRVFDDYCRYGLLPKGDAFTLACAPAIEAAVYDAGTTPDADLTALLPKIDVPALVIRTARQQTHPQDFMASPTRPDLASLLRQGADKCVEGSHFVPMEAPDNVAAWIESII